MNSSPEFNSIYKYYRRIRSLVAGKGFSKYRFLRNLDYLIRHIINQPENIIVFRGLKYFLDKRGSVGSFQDFGMKLINDFIIPGDVFVDVGASFGSYTVSASRKIGIGGKVFAFEPNATSYNLLLKNIKENKCLNVIAENIAISNSLGECNLYTVGDVLEGSSLINPESDPDFFVTRVLSDFENNKISKFSVKKTTLDEYFENQNITYLKTDTEGNDGLVFEGMHKVIKNNPNIVVQMEFLPAMLQKFGTSPYALLTTIQKLGFKIFFVTDKPHRVLLSECAKFSGDIIFTRRGDVIKAIRKIVEL